MNFINTIVKRKVRITVTTISAICILTGLICGLGTKSDQEFHSEDCYMKCLMTGGHFLQGSIYRVRFRGKIWIKTKSRAIAKILLELTDTKKSFISSVCHKGIEETKEYNQNTDLYSLEEIMALLGVTDEQRGMRFNKGCSLGFPGVSLGVIAALINGHPPRSWSLYEWLVKKSP